MATYNVHAGHCPQDQGAYGAVGILQESVEDRIVKNAIIAKLNHLGILFMIVHVMKIHHRMVV